MLAECLQGFERYSGESVRLYGAACPSDEAEAGRQNFAAYKGYIARLYGLRNDQQAQVYYGVELPNYWNVRTFYIHKATTDDDRRTRGGRPCVAASAARHPSGDRRADVGRRARDPDGHQLGPAGTTVDDPEAAPGQPGVDAQHTHGGPPRARTGVRTGAYGEARRPPGRRASGVPRPERAPTLRHCSTCRTSRSPVDSPPHPSCPRS